MSWLLYGGPVIFGPTEDFVSWLQNKGLLASSRTSSCSGAVMRLGRGVMSVMVVYGDVPSARLLRVSMREVFYKVQDASEEVVVTPSLLGAPVPCKGCR